MTDDDYQDRLARLQQRAISDPDLSWLIEAWTDLAVDRAVDGYFAEKTADVFDEARAERVRAHTKHGDCPVCGEIESKS